MSQATDSRSGEPPSSSSLQSSVHEPASAPRLTEQQPQPGPSLLLADESAPALLTPGTTHHPPQPRVAGGTPAAPLVSTPGQAAAIGPATAATDVQLQQQLQVQQQQLQQLQQYQQQQQQQNVQMLAMMQNMVAHLSATPPAPPARAPTPPAVVV